jgi:hypothetical protein
LPRIRQLAGVPRSRGPAESLLRNAVPIFAVILCLIVIAQSSLEAWRLLLGLVATGTVLRLVARRTSRTRAER